MLSFTVSARNKPEELPIGDYLVDHFGDIPLSSMDSVFGFFERSALYGGRPFSRPELSSADADWLMQRGIGVRIPLTNVIATKEAYEASKELLVRHHIAGNSVIVVDDGLAQWIRKDYPLYEIEASAIKNLNTIKKIRAALSLYDTVVLPAIVNDDHELLASVPEKERVRLFVDAGCAASCKSKICYPVISRMNRGEAHDGPICSRQLRQRQVEKRAYDVDFFQKLGFMRFKRLHPAK